MKILLHPCQTCAHQSAVRLPSRVVSLRDDQIYVSTCTQGHKEVTHYNHHKFDMLYMSALNALVDGYYRDAVTTFAACLERFYVFYAEAVLWRHGITAEAFDEAKEVVWQSERQLGLFVAAYLLATAKAPADIDSRQVKMQQPGTKKSFKKFRNDVVHNGLIPTEDEAKQVGDIVFRYIQSICASTPLMVTDWNAVSGYMQSRVLHQLQDAIATKPEFQGYSRVGMVGGMILINAIFPALQSQTIEDQIATVAAWRK